MWKSHRSETREQQMPTSLYSPTRGQPRCGSVVEHTKTLKPVLQSRKFSGSGYSDGTADAGVDSTTTTTTTTTPRSSTCEYDLGEEGSGGFGSSSSSQVIGIILSSFKSSQRQSRPILRTLAAEPQTPRQHRRDASNSYFVF
ncbi:hypothetical protein EYF80_039754 [Liparis tanakae]|uniref:Uncharacterized protein n=1 Tax=Liparis tanakae TaxID=230148 RepID=A0A4Z2G953_9TELE|nr:hypothetical protein EYF80_039754 [Liparis tanakae]